VPGLEIIPFADEHLDSAGALLAERHRRHREAEPLLAPRYEEPSAAQAELEAAWREDEASGAAAFRGSRMVGYLIGAPRSDSTWGDNVWVELPGHAVQEPEVVRDLYAVAAARWIEQRRPRHYVLVPGSDPAVVESWFHVCFGHQHTHGVREVPAQTDVRLPEGFEIRPPDPGEVEELIEIDLALPRHQRSSPVFSSVPLPTREESRDEWLSMLAGDEEKTLIGSRNGRPVACWALVPVERSRENRGLLRPDNACFLGFAATLPEARGSGIGVALTDASFAWAAEQGYPVMTTDWRATNLLSSRFWPRRGFRTTFLRLYRSIP
jgi:GNAT superfamily N-acetyltransferase